MSTRSIDLGLSLTLFGKTRRALLALLYTHTDQAFYLRQLVRAAGVGLGAGQRELKRLSDAGILRRIERGQQVYFQADAKCPVFAEMKGLVIKTIGIGDVLRAALAPLADRINAAFIYGSFARHEERAGSDLDILVVGAVTFAELVSTLEAAQKKLRREINPTVYPRNEFRSKLAAKHHFLTSVLKEKKKIFLVGDEHELARLAQELLAQAPQKQPPRNQGLARPR